jgi:hypothetical protein
MRDPRRPAAFQAALRYVMASDILAEHKATLIDVLQDALRAEETADIHRQAAAQAEGEWQDGEIVLLKGFLQDRIASSWQQADESVMYLAAQLRRDPRSVRDKATELGFGASVDYRLANRVRNARDD